MDSGRVLLALKEREKWRDRRERLRNPLRSVRARAGGARVRRLRPREAVIRGRVVGGRGTRKGPRAHPRDRGRPAGGGGGGRPHRDGARDRRGPSRLLRFSGGGDEAGPPAPEPRRADPLPALVTWCAYPG